MNKVTQKDRVLRLLRERGPLGVCMQDFDGGTRPPADGLGRFTRLGGRIDELKKDGHEIDASGRRDRFAVYVLTKDAGDGVVAPETTGGPTLKEADPGDGTNTLFPTAEDIPRPCSAILGIEAA